MINNINEGGRMAENLVHLPNPTHLYHVKFFSTGALTLHYPSPPTPPSFQPSLLLLLVYLSIPPSRKPVSAQLLYFSSVQNFSSCRTVTGETPPAAQPVNFQLFSVICCQTHKKVNSYVKLESILISL